jgi:hypothetical protein
VKFLTVGVAAALAITGAALLLSGDSSGPKTAAAAAATASTLTGSINLTCSQGGCGTFSAWKCNGPVDLDSVYVNVDYPGGIVNGHGLDAVTLTANCTGRIGLLTIIQDSEDGLKINGAHDISIGGVGSTITLDGISSPLDHQDAIQVTSGRNVYLDQIATDGPTATNGQLYINATGLSLPDHVVCTGCSFKSNPTHFNNVIVNGSTNSGVVDSIICPDARTDPLLIGPRAVDPVNVDDVFPDSC